MSPAISMIPAHRSAALRASKTHTGRVARIAATVLFVGVAGVLPAPLLAQLPGLPVLQNAFAAPGIALAGNVGSGGGDLAFAGAAGWAPGGGRLQLSIGAGSFTPDSGSASGAYGGRASIALPFLFARDGAFGLAAFGGVGGATRKDVSLTTLPIGVAIGYRRALGTTRTLSLYGAPFYSRTSLTVRDSTATSNLVRFSAGADVALLRSVGVSVGLESGGKAKDGKPGPRGTLVGFGVSYKLR